MGKRFLQACNKFCVSYVFKSNWKVINYKLPLLFDWNKA